MQEYGNLANTFSDYLIYDDRKGRVLHTRYLNKAQFYEMWRFHFNRLRPDFSESDSNSFVIAQRVTRGILAILRNANLAELKRAVYLDELAYPDDKTQDILLNHFNYLAPSPSATLFSKTLSWIDATKNLVYMQKVVAKVEQYGLHYPMLSKELTEEQKMQLEESIYLHFKSLLTKD